MDMALRVFVAVGAMILGIFIVGCGSDDDADSSAPTVEKEPEVTFGLDGDTYRNRRLFKVSNLPVNDWTVKEVTKAVEGEEAENFLVGFLCLFHCIIQHTRIERTLPSSRSPTR